MLDRLIADAPPPSYWVVLGTLALAALVVWSRPIWPVARNVVTIAHEAGHALVALATGRRLAGIRLHSDTSGVTVSVGRPTGLGMVLTLAVGYPAPTLLGLAAAATLAAGRVTLLLWIAVALLAGMLVMIRNLYGALSLLVVGGAVLAVSCWAPAEVQGAFGYLLAWLLLLGGVRPVLELARSRSKGSDADQLARLTGVPGLLWIGFFVMVTFAALAAGAALLLR
ncbi:M50 family metallopeptidase [soil metagenome]